METTMHEFIMSLIAQIIALSSVAKGPESRPLGPNARLIAYPSGRLFLASPLLPGNVEVATAEDVMAIASAYGINVEEPKRTLTVAEALALAPKATEPKAVAVDPGKKSRVIRVIKKA